MPMTKRIEETPFDETMRCYVHRVEYDFARKHGVIWVDKNDFPHKESVVAFFKAIDKSVKRVDTFHGDRRDTLLFAA